MPDPPQIIVDDRPLRRTLTGVGSYIAQLLLHLPHVAPDLAITPFVLRYVRRQRDWQEYLRRMLRAAEDAPLAPGGAPSDVGKTRTDWLVRVAIQAAYSTAFRTLTRGYRLYHEPNHVPVRCGLPTIVTIHDLSVPLHPDWHPADRVRWYERDFRPGLQRAARFLTPSAFTKSEMVRHLGLSAERIDVTPLAARGAFSPQPPERVSQVLAALRLPAAFYLYVGTLEPRKNVEGLLDAYAALPSALRADQPLVIAGAWGWKAESLREKLTARGLGESVRLLGYLHDGPLAALYTACTALVWPTWYEGFGLPPLEAMACGAAVIVSDVASLPEVVGDAGVRLDPQDGSAWTQAMRRVAEDAAWRAARRSAALERARQFSWEKCAQQTAQAYRRVLADVPA